MKPGDTFRIHEPGTTLDNHLWVVISDPTKNTKDILIVNFTTLRNDSERACLLNAGDHPFVKHPTCVNYGKSRVVPQSTVKDLINKGIVTSHAPVSEEILQRIREGAAASERMSLEHAEILIDQGLIDC